MPNEATLETSLLDEGTALQFIDLIGESRAQILFGKFTTEAHDIISRVSKAKTFSDFQKLLPDIHNLAGSAATFGFKGLHDALASIEVALGANPLDPDKSLPFDIKRIFADSLISYSELAGNP